MGKFEVLELLTTLRQTGENGYLSYGEVHDLLRRSGAGLSYQSVWRTLNTLWSDHLLEVQTEVNGLQRTILFRARVSSRLHTSQMKRVHNILQGQDEKSRCDTTGKALGRGAKGGVVARG